MFLSAFLILNGRWLRSSLIHPSRRLTVCIRRSTRPMGRWSLAGAYIRLISCFAHRNFTLLLFRQGAWSSLMFRGTPCWAMYLFRNFSMFGPFVFVTNFKVGNFEKRSMHARKYTFSPVHQILVPRSLIGFLRLVLSIVVKVPSGFLDLCFLYSYRILCRVGMFSICLSNRGWWRANIYVVLIRSCPMLPGAWSVGHLWPILWGCWGYRVCCLIVHNRFVRLDFSTRRGFVFWASCIVVRPQLGCSHVLHDVRYRGWS